MKEKLAKADPKWLVYRLGISTPTAYRYVGDPDLLDRASVGFLLQVMELLNVDINDNK